MFCHFPIKSLIYLISFEQLIGLVQKPFQLFIATIMPIWLAEWCRVSRKRTEMRKMSFGQA
jgi:hypothetical protein